MRSFKVVLLSFVVCSLFAQMIFAQDAAAAEKVYKWRAVSHQMVGTTRYNETVVPFCEMVAKASNGRLIIEPYGAGVLFPASETFDAVADGMVEMAMIWSGFWGSKHPLFVIASGRPGGPIRTYNESFYRAERTFPLIDKLYTKFGIKFLGAFDYNPAEIIMGRIPIRSVEELKGKNIRAAGLSAPFYTKLGASVVQLSAPELYQAMQLGTVDLVEYNDWQVNKEMALDEVTKYVMLPAMHGDVADDKDLIVNPKAWESLPEDLKAIVLACRDMARYKSAVAFGAGGDVARQKWVDRGIEIINFSEEDVNKLRQVGVELLLEASAKNAEVKEYVDEYAKVLAELGYTKEATELGYKK